MTSPLFWYPSHTRPGLVIGTILFSAVRFGRVPKREKAKIIEQMQKVNAQSQVSVLNSILENENEVIQKIIDSHFRLCDFTRAKFCSFFEKAWAQPRFVECPAHKACPLNPAPSEHDSMSQWDEFSDCFTPAIRNVVYFAKCIPGFSVFSQEDQVTLLKVRILVYFMLGPCDARTIAPMDSAFHCRLAPLKSSWCTSHLCLTPEQTPCCLLMARCISAHHRV